MAEQKQKIQVQIQEGVRKGIYSNAVSVAVRESEVVLDFGYVLPGVTPPTIDVASRININHRSAEQLVTILQNALLDFRNKKKEKK